MERKLARIERILQIASIPGADAIEAATVGGWKVVVKKGLYKADQLAVFFEIDSLIPHRPWSAFLFKDTRELYRLKTVKLRGQISQGLLVPIEEIPELAAREWTEGDDLTELLVIKKWEPNIPANLAGQIKGNFPTFLRKTDECRIQSSPEVLDEIKDIPIYISLKMDGTSLTAYKHEGVFGVCSRNLELREEGGDDYWAMAKALKLPETLPDGYAIQGEMCGPGIQGNKAGLKEGQLFVFNVWDINEQRYLDYGAFETFVRDLGLQTVPILVSASTVAPRLPDTVNDWLSYVETITYPNGAQAEGVVVRPLVERYSPTLDSRLSFKVISNKFLLKNGE